jgi:hypothetical protein
VRECLATQWLRYFTRRTESGGDTASLQAANAAFAKSSLRHARAAWWR